MNEHSELHFDKDTIGYDLLYKPQTDNKYNRIVAELDKARDAHEGIVGILNYLNLNDNNEEDHNQRGFLHIKMLVEAWGMYDGLIDILKENIGTHKEYVRHGLIYGGLLESEAEIEAEYIEGMQRAIRVIDKAETDPRMLKADILQFTARRAGKNLGSTLGGVTNITTHRTGDPFYDFINDSLRD